MLLFKGDALAFEPRPLVLAAVQKPDVLLHSSQIYRPEWRSEEHSAGWIVALSTERRACAAINPQVDAIDEVGAAAGKICHCIADILDPPDA